MINPIQEKKVDESSKLLTEYLAFLQNHQCVAQSTMGIRRNYVAAFLNTLKERATPSKIRNLAANTIHDYIIQTAGPFSRAKRKHLVSSLRSFLRFLHIRGYLNRNLLPAVPIIRTYKLATIPRGIPWDSVQKLLSMPDRTTPVGRRDYAVLQLLATYGVRIRQALNLRICDIKWEEKTIYFEPSKGGKPLRFPLQKDAAQAILEYIRMDRGNAPFPHVFLVIKEPKKPLSPKNKLGESLKRYYKLAGIESTAGVTHPIRHAFATRLMEQGVPIKTIADLLGHRCIDTTFIYTKVDLRHLRLLARDWPEVLP